MLRRDNPICNPSCSDCPAAAAVLAAIARLEAKMDRLLPSPEPEPEPEPVPPLVRALAEVFGARCFTARAVWQHATEEADRAAARGEPEPDLWAALRELGIETTRSLGHHLSRWEGEGKGIGRGGPEHKTNTWEVLAWARRG